MKLTIKQTNLVCLTVKLKNTTDKPIVVDIAYSPFEYTKLNSLSRDFIKCKDLVYLGRMCKPCDRTKLVRIEPGESIKGVLNLSTGYDLEEDMSYNIQVEFFITINNELIKLKSNKIDFILPEIKL